MTLSASMLRSAAATQRLVESESAERLVEESGLLLRSVRDLRRISSHLASFAYPILHRPHPATTPAQERPVRAPVPTAVR
jgi:hypothetical protein